MSGHINLHRKIFEWEWYSDINTCRLFIHMLLSANWKDGNFHGITVKRGSFVSSYEKLSSQTSLTIREIRTAISHLKSTGEVTNKSTSKYTVFTVVKYDLYQRNDIQSDKRTTNERQTNDKLTTTIEEGNKEIKEEINKNTTDTVINIIENKDNQQQKKLIKYFVEHIDPMASSFVVEKLCNWIEIFSVDVIIKAIDESVIQNKRSYSYVEGILKAWDKLGLNTLNLVEGHIKEWQDKKNKKNIVKNNSANKFNNFEQRDHNDDYYKDLEEKLLNK